MKYFAVAVIYAGFFCLIGFAVYCTKTGWPLFALIFTPSVEEKPKGD